MKNRIKEIRKSLDLTQQEFADKIGISRGNIGAYEVGKNSPSDAVISLICKTFNVNESWLRTGEGQMFNELSIDSEISVWLQKIQAENDNSLKKRYILMLSRMSDIEWEILEKKIMEIANMDEK